jgi:hypothetical protein
MCSRTRKNNMKYALLCMLLSAILFGCSADNIIAPSFGSIQGLVKDPRSMKPLANVQIYSLPGTGLALTNDSGMYRIDDIVPGEYMLSAYYRDTVFAGYAMMPVRVNSNATTRTDLILKAGAPDKGVISGRVIDEFGRPVSGATVTTEPMTTTEITTSEGYFLFTDVPDDSLTIFVTNGTLYGRGHIYALPGLLTKIAITAYLQDPTKGWVSGRVTSKGEPVSGAIVRADSLGLADTTDDNGRYILRNLLPGLNNISVTRDGFQRRSFVVTAVANAETVKDMAMGSTSAIATDNLELYIPIDGSIDDRSTRFHKTAQYGKGIKFVADRYGRENEAVECTGWNGITTLDGSQMNFSPMTLGAWLYIPSTLNNTSLLLGKTPHPSGDGCYVVFENASLVFMYVTNAWAQSSRTVFASNTFPRDQWFWIGFAVALDGSGYATVNGTTTKAIPTVMNTMTNQEQFVFGNLPSTQNFPGLIGKIDQIVLYSSYKNATELKRIMEVYE